MPDLDDATRVQRLLEAQAKALALFDEVVARALVVPGISEREASDAVRDLASEMFATKRHWHKRIVRSGPNTLKVYRAKSVERVIGEDDIVFLDFGPIFDDWEADFGRTFVIGEDPRKLALCAALPTLFDLGVAHFRAHPSITGAQLFDYVVAESRKSGWEFGGTIAGHLVGKFPHDRMPGDPRFSRITVGNDLPMRRLDERGNPANWILEIHIVDRDLQIGGFHEELLLDV